MTELKAFTDYPFAELGDTASMLAPVRECVITDYDGDKYCMIVVNGLVAEIKRGYIYKKPLRLPSNPPLFTHDELCEAFPPTPE